MGNFIKFIIVCVILFFVGGMIYTCVSDSSYQFKRENKKEEKEIAAIEKVENQRRAGLKNLMPPLELANNITVVVIDPMENPSTFDGAINTAIQKNYEEKLKKKEEYLTKAEKYKKEAARETDPEKKKRYEGYYDDNMGYYKDADISKLTIAQGRSEINKWVSGRTTVLSQTQGISVVDRSKIDIILREHKFQNTSWTDNSTNVAELGKALNANYLVFLYPKISSSYYSGFSVNGEIEFLNVNSMKKVSFYANNINEWNLFMLGSEISKEDLYGTWFYNGIKKTDTAYTEETIQYITPFIPGKVLQDIGAKAEKKFKSPLKKGSELVFGDTVLVNDEDAKMTFKSELREYFSTCKAKYEKYTKTFSDSKYENKGYVSTYKVGNLIVRKQDTVYINGFTYLYGDQLGIYLGTDGKNGTGHAYFMMFTKE